MVKKGEFPKPIKIGRSSLWTQEQVQAYMRQKAKEAGY
jgi:prophage regulatory protein